MTDAMIASAPRTRELGIGLQTDKAPGRYAELAQIAEEGGIDVVSVFGDLLYQPPVLALLEIARATSRVRLGAAGFTPFTVHPYEIAGQLAAIDAASDGRAYLGLVRGSWLTAIGITGPRPVEALGEAAAVIASLLAGEGEGVTGRTFSLQPGTRLRYPVRRPRVPVLLGAWGPRGAALAGRIADEVKIGGTANPAMVPVMRERIRVGTDAAGRAAEDVGIVVGAVTVVDRDGRAARALARREVAMYLDVVGDLDPTIELPEELLVGVRQALADGDADAAGRRIPDDVLRLFAFAGDPDEVAAQAQACFDAGAHRVEFGTPIGADEVAGVRLLCEAVVPSLPRSHR